MLLLEVFDGRERKEAGTLRILRVLCMLSVNDSIFKGSDLKLRRTEFRGSTGLRNLDDGTSAQRLAPEEITATEIDPVRARYKLSTRESKNRSRLLRPAPTTNHLIPWSAILEQVY